MGGLAGGMRAGCCVGAFDWLVILILLADQRMNEDFRQIGICLDEQKKHTKSKDLFAVYTEMPICSYWRCIGKNRINRATWEVTRTHQQVGVILTP
jgi:hypothetical protein